MANGDKNYKHMVVLTPMVQIGYLDSPHLCFTASGEPAVFHDSPPAELLAAQLRESNPAGRYSVISFQVL